MCASGHVQILKALYSSRCRKRCKNPVKFSRKRATPLEDCLRPIFHFHDWKECKSHRFSARSQGSLSSDSASAWPAPSKWMSDSAVTSLRRLPRPGEVPPFQINWMARLCLGMPQKWTSVFLLVSLTKTGCSQTNKQTQTSRFRSVATGRPQRFAIFSGTNFRGSPP